MSFLKKKSILVVVCIAALAGISAYFFTAGHSKVSFCLRVDEKALAEAGRVEVTDLFPKPNGGYRFQADNGMSVYIVYATRPEDSAKGTIKTIKIQGGGSDYMEFHPLAFSDEASDACKSGADMTGFPGAGPLPLTFLKDIKKGTYSMILPTTCKKMTLEIVSPS